MNKPIVIFFSFCLFACSSPRKDTEANNVAENESKVEAQEREKIPVLEGTKWRFKVVEGVYNVYEFTSERDFKYSNAELEDTFYGDYKIENDTLYIFKKISASDSLLSESSPHRSLKTRSKYIIKDGKLLLVYNEYSHTTGWIATNPNSDIFFIKEN